MNTLEDLPLLRSRENGVEHRFNHIMVLAGHVEAVNEEIIRLHQGRDRYTEIFFQDFKKALGGARMTLDILRDAGEHNDLIKIGLTHDRITYENPTQHERLRQAVKARASA